MGTRGLFYELYLSLLNNWLPFQPPVWKTTPPASFAAGLSEPFLFGNRVQCWRGRRWGLSAIFLFFWWDLDISLGRGSFLLRQPLLCTCAGCDESESNSELQQVDWACWVHALLPRFSNESACKLYDKGKFNNPNPKSYAWHARTPLLKLILLHAWIFEDKLGCFLHTVIYGQPFLPDAWTGREYLP